MRYMGGKTRIAKQIAAVIDQYREPGQLVWDAFCGGLSVSVALSKKGPVLASDVCAPLINLYKAVQDGWDPPTVVTKEQYEVAKLLPDTDPMKAFCGFGCSFGGKWFGGHVGKETVTKVTVNRPKSHAKIGDLIKANPIKAAATGLVRDCRLQHINFSCIDFLRDMPTHQCQIIYCDIPYKGTTGYSAVLPFDQGLFLDRVLELNQFSHIFISEYSFPLGYLVWEQTAPDSGCFARQVTATERLFHIPKGSLS